MFKKQDNALQDFQEEFFETFLEKLQEINSDVIYYGILEIKESN